MLVSVLIRVCSRCTSEEEVRLNLPNELRVDHPGPSRATEEHDEEQQKQRQFAHALQENVKKIKRDKKKKQ